MACLVLYATWALAESPLIPFTAEYAVQVKGLKVGGMTRTLEIDAAGRYRLESRMAPSGLAALVSRTAVDEISEGALLQPGVHPHRYRYHKSSKGKDKYIESVFERATSRVRTTQRGTTSTLDVPPGALDKLAYQLALMEDLGRGRTTFEYHVVDGDRLKTYALDDQGEETLEIDGQPVIARKMVYARHGTQRRTTLWCAPRHGFLPVRIEYREDDGGVTTATLIALP